jgi:hypothetical protein
VSARAGPWHGGGMTKLTRTIVLALALVVASSAVAIASTPRSGNWKATKVQSGYDLKFTVKKGKITNIVGHVLEYCDGSSTSDTTTFAPDSSWKIGKGGKFSGRHKETSGQVTVYFTFEGKISGSKASGKLREESIVAGSTCDTHKLSWTAKPGG